MLHQKSEKGQAIILIVFAMIGLIGITGLTVDGSMAFDDRRHAQNAADSAAFAGALANSKNQDIVLAAQSIAVSNGYDNNGASNVVTVSYVNSPSGTCPDDIASNKDITVDITSTMKTYFAPVVGIRTMTNKVTATTRACGLYVAPLFGGNAVVGLNPSTDTCAFDSGSNAAHWVLIGGGIFSNGCATAHAEGTVDLTGECVFTVGNAENFTCQQENQTQDAVAYPDAVLAIMPPNPCDGTAGDVGLPQPPNVDGAVVASNGVYCITDFDAYDHADIFLDHATLYVTDLDFDVKFAGGGGFRGEPTASGPYSSYFMVVAYDSTPCESFSDNGSQRFEYRGNSGIGDVLYGTILAPSACIDFRGNSNNEAVHSQIIGFNVSANGDANVSISYNADENRRDPSYPSVQLLK